MENTSDSLMPRPLLLCLKSEKIVCYSVPDNTWQKHLKTAIIPDGIFDTKSAGTGFENK